MSSLVVFALTTLVTASSPDAPKRERFQEAFLAGEALYQKQQYLDAAQRFREADLLFALPETAYNLARCYEKMNQSGLKAYYLRQYLKRAPKAADTIENEAQLNYLLSKAAEKNQGYLEVEAPNASYIKLSNQPATTSPLALFLPAGDYDVVVQLPDRIERVKLTVTAGRETTRVYYSTTPAVATSGTSTPALGLTAPIKTSDTRSTLHQASWWVMGSAAAVLVAGAFTGSLSAADGNLLQQPSKLQAMQGQSIADSANAKGRAANTLMAVGGGLAAIGTGLFVFTLPLPQPTEASR